MVSPTFLLMKILLFLFILTTSTLSLAETKLDFSGNIEGQLRNSRNNDKAKSDLAQDWNNENFYLLYGNLNGKLEIGDSRVEANWFVRYSESDLYQPAPSVLGNRGPYLATQIFTFPNKLVARDIFKLQSSNVSGNHKTETSLNKLYYELDIFIYYIPRFCMALSICPVAS